MVGSFSERSRIGRALEMTLQPFSANFSQILEDHFSWQAQYLVRLEGDININCPLRVIRTACSTLGLSVRGSKKINMQRLQNFVKTQELMAAHSVETQLRSESKREVRVQKRPVEPTKEQIEKRNLTHEPFEEWCELCVSFRSRQDKHSSTDDCCSTHCK